MKLVEADMCKGGKAFFVKGSLTAGGYAYKDHGFFHASYTLPFLFFLLYQTLSEKSISLIVLILLFVHGIIYLSSNPKEDKQHDDIC